MRGTTHLTMDLAPCMLAKLGGTIICSLKTWEGYHIKTKALYGVLKKKPVPQGLQRSAQGNMLGKKQKLECALDELTEVGELTCLGADIF